MSIIESISERYKYSEDIESIVDMKDSTDELGLEMTTADVLERLNQLEAEIERFERRVAWLEKHLQECLNTGELVDCPTT